MEEVWAGQNNKATVGDSDFYTLYKQYAKLTDVLRRGGVANAKLAPHSVTAGKKVLNGVNISHVLLLSS